MSDEIAKYIEKLERENAVFEQCMNEALRALKGIAGYSKSSMDELLNERGVKTEYWRENREHFEYLRTMDNELAQLTVDSIDDKLRELRNSTNSSPQERTE